MSDASVTNKPVRPRMKYSCESEESCAEQELNGLEEGDAMTDEEERVEVEGEAETADWRVREGPRSEPTAREREEHEATHMPFCDWCAYWMISRDRTQHHESKKSSEDLSRRPIIAMDYNFLQPNSTASSQAIPDELLTCIVVKKDRHQSSVVLKKRIEDPWASERMTRFINSLGYKEITLKSDTESAIIAFRNRVAENGKREVTLEDAVKGDKPSNGLVENATMLLRGVIRTIKCHVESCTQKELREDSPILPWLVEHAVIIFVHVSEGSRQSDVIRKIACQEACTRICTFRREGAGETNILRTVEQNESQIQVRSVTGSEKTMLSASWDGRRCIQSAGSQEGRTERQVGQRNETM